MDCPKGLIARPRPHHAWCRGSPQPCDCMLSVKTLSHPFPYAKRARTKSWQMDTTLGLQCYEDLNKS
eukprot:4915635-Amphidinium_carterae.1